MSTDPDRFHREHRSLNSPASDRTVQSTFKRLGDEFGLSRIEDRESLCRLSEPLALGKGREKTHHNPEDEAAADEPEQQLGAAPALVQEARLLPLFAVRHHVFHATDRAAPFGGGLDLGCLVGVLPLGLQSS